MKLLMKLKGNTMQITADILTTEVVLLKETNILRSSIVVTANCKMDNAHNQIV